MRERVRRPLLLAAGGGALLAGSWLALRAPALQRADVRAGDLLRYAGSREVDRAVVATTDLGSLYAVGAASSVLALAGRRDSAADAAGVGLLAWCVSQRAKTRVRRARPYEAHGTRRLLRPPTGSSFPSGHATVAAALSAVLAERVPARTQRRLLLLLGPYVALTRVYAGVHYPTDVIGGVGMGYLLAAGWRGTARRTGGAAVRRLGDGLVAWGGAVRGLTRRASSGS